MVCGSVPYSHSDFPSNLAQFSPSLRNATYSMACWLRYSPSDPDPWSHGCRRKWRTYRRRTAFATPRSLIPVSLRSYLINFLTMYIPPLLRTEPPFSEFQSFDLWFINSTTLSFFSEFFIPHSLRSEFYISLAISQWSRTWSWSRCWAREILS